MSETEGARPKAATRQCDLAVLAALGLLALVLRWYRLDAGLWYDEIMSVFGFFKRPWIYLLTSMPIPNHHPLYSLLGKLSIGLGGESEAWARAPAAIFGTLTPPVVFLLGRRHGHRVAGIVAGVLVAVNPWSVWQGQDARGYSAAIFFLAVAQYHFLGLRGRGPLPALVGCAVGGALAIYSHMYAGAVVAAQLLVGAGIAVCRRAEGQGWTLVAGPAAALALAGFMYLPLLKDFLAFIKDSGLVNTGRAVNLSFCWQLLTSWAAGEKHPLLSLPLILSFAAGAVISLRGRSADGWVWLLALAISLLLPLVAGMYVFTRFFSFMLVPTSLFAGLAVERFLVGSGRRTRGAGWALMIVLVLTLAPGLTEYYRLGKQGFKTAAEWLAREHPDRKVFVIGIGSNVYWYYDRGAVRIPWGEALDPRVLPGAAVVLSHPWSVLDQDEELLDARCDRGLFLPSAGPREYDVTVYLCGG